MSVIGVIPAAGLGSRIQPVYCSKELLPVPASGSTVPVSEFLMDRMKQAGVDRVCMVVGRTKGDLIQHYGSRAFYVAQDEPRGLCDAVFSAVPFVDESDTVLIGLPDTIWFPVDCFKEHLGNVTLILFPRNNPEHFDAVCTDVEGRVTKVESKQPNPQSCWIWGAMRMTGWDYHSLACLWASRGDENFGTLFNEYIRRGGEVYGSYAGETYLDVGTPNGYREAIEFLSRSNL